MKEFYDELIKAVNREDSNIVNIYLVSALNFECYHNMINVLKIAKDYNSSINWNRLLSKTRMTIVKTLVVTEAKANEIIGLTV